MWSAPDGGVSARPEVSSPRPGDATGSEQRAEISALILDVDGVVLASPHERAWREALAGFTDPDRFTSALYQAEVAGKPRLDGALAALVALDVADPARQAPIYARRKQSRLEAIVLAEGVSPFPDALRFVEATLVLGLKLAAASSSKNANQMMRSLTLASGEPLLDAFSVNVCGRDLRRGKPDPGLFLLAAAELGQPPGKCLVVEDAPSGVAAARAGGMWSLGVARHADGPGLETAGADLVVTSLDDVGLSDLAEGRLRRRGT